MAGNYIALLYIAAIAGVLGAGYWVNNRKAIRRITVSTQGLAAGAVSPVRVASDNRKG